MLGWAEAIGVLGWYHLFVFGALFPVLAVYQGRKLESLTALPARSKFYVSTMVNGVLFACFSLLVARSCGTELFPAYRPSFRDVCLIVAVLLILFSALQSTFRQAIATRNKRLWLFTPRDSKERALWIGVSVVAGIGEEITYRGVLVALFATATGSIPAAIALSILCFAVSHGYQGWTSAAITGVMAGCFHLLVHLTGSLIPAMVVHTIYDIYAGLNYGRLAEAAGLPKEWTTDAQEKPIVSSTVGEGPIITSVMFDGIGE